MSVEKSDPELSTTFDTRSLPSSAPAADIGTRQLSSSKPSRSGRNFIIFFMVICCVFANLIIYVAIPADRANNLRKQQEQDANLRMPAMMAELLKEVRLLRKAVENLGKGQEL